MDNEEDPQLQIAYKSIKFEFQNAFDLVEDSCYDAIHDKGTFDVVYMHPELSNQDYAKAMRHRLNATNPDAVFTRISTPPSACEAAAI